MADDIKNPRKERSLLSRIVGGLVRAFGSFSLYPAPIELSEINPAYGARTPEQRDALALAGDWKKIGQDMGTTIRKYRLR